MANDSPYRSNDTDELISLRAENATLREELRNGYTPVQFWDVNLPEMAHRAGFLLIACCLFRIFTWLNPVPTDSIMYTLSTHDPWMFSWIMAQSVGCGYLCIRGVAWRRE